MEKNATGTVFGSAALADDLIQILNKDEFKIPYFWRLRPSLTKVT